MDCIKWFAWLFCFGWGIIAFEANAQLNPPQQVGVSPTQNLPSEPSSASIPTLTDSTDSELTASPTIQSASPVSPVKILYVFDLYNYLLRQPENKSWQYDVINLVTALQGIVNREEPQLYILFVHERLSSFQMNVDEFWLRMLRGPNNFLSHHELVPVDSLEKLLVLFREYYSAIVLWDPNLPATGNVALTIAGADGLLPVRFDKSPGSLYNQIVASGPEISPQVQLTNKFTGSGYIPDSNEGALSTKTAKTDAYMWAKLNYLDSGLCSSTYLANFLDPYDWDPKTAGYQYPDLQNCLIVNHDFYVSQKAFFMDLDPWFDETATDSSNNPFNSGIDLYMLLELLKSAYSRTPGHERILRIGGFVPWWIKYSNQYIHPGGQSGQHSPAATAEEFIGHISKFNGILDADSVPIASLANASVFQHVPLESRYYQNPVSSPSLLENKNYLLFCIGDFRSSAQLYQTIPILWHDSLRGEMPIAWAISPILSERVPHIFDYLYKTRTPNDFFVSGTPGAGLCYINRLLPESRPEEMGSGIPFWERISRLLYERFDLHTSIGTDLSREIRVTSFSADLQKSFLSFSPHGVSTLKSFEHPLVEKVLPFIQEKANFIDKIPGMDTMIQRILANSREGEPVFHIYRFNLANPTTLYFLLQRLQNEYKQYQYTAVDPYTFFYLLRQNHSQNDPSANFLLPTFISDTIPLEMETGEYYPSTIVIRNDGWDTWNPPEILPNRGYRLTYRWYYLEEEIPGTGWHTAYIKVPVNPGSQADFNLNILAPDQPRVYKLALIFGQENVRESYLRKEILIVVKSKAK